MEISYLTSSGNLQNLQRLGYSSSRKYFQHRAYQKTQRLIPLTREIEKAMINFNGSESDTSNTEEHIFNTMSTIRLVRGEVHNILQKFSNSDQLMRREKIDCETKLQHVILHDTNDELEITIKDITEDQDNTVLFVKSIQNLEHRIAKLEKRTKFLLKKIPKLRLLQAKKFKIFISPYKNKRYSLKETSSQIKRDSLKKKDDKNEDNETTYNIYEDLFYTTREYTFNLLYYKKSLESLELNRKPQRNPYVKPICDVLLSQGNIKKRSMFLTS